jgi:hypothetical protein
MTTSLLPCHGSREQFSAFRLTAVLKFTRIVVHERHQVAHALTLELALYSDLKVLRPDPLPGRVSLSKGRGIPSIAGVQGFLDGGQDGATGEAEQGARDERLVAIGCLAGVIDANRYLPRRRRPCLSPAVGFGRNYCP